ncbi:HPr family phosphocarrier protein [Ruminococcus flavefaciens]|nr:HPr family phosphocarrier protein [Ruminococcus flavefaciens]
MVSKKVTIVNAEGMHMRPAGMIAKAVKVHSDSEIILNHHQSKGAERLR